MTQWIVRVEWLTGETFYYGPFDTMDEAVNWSKGAEGVYVQVSRLITV